MTSPLVSIVVPAFDADATLERCIRSIVRQKCSFSFEVIIVDNGKNNSLPALAKAYPEVIVLSTSKKGRSLARNTGWRAARGEFVAFVDADVQISLGWINRAVTTLLTTNAAGGQGRIYPVSTGIPPSLAKYRFRATRTTTQGTFNHLSVQTPEAPMINSASCIYRRAVLEKLGGFDDNLSRHEDIDLSKRCAQLGHTLTQLPGCHSWVVYGRGGWISYLVRAISEGWSKARYLQKWAPSSTELISRDRRPWRVASSQIRALFRGLSRGDSFHLIDLFLNFIRWGVRRLSIMRLEFGPLLGLATAITACGIANAIMATPNFQFDELLMLEKLHQQSLLDLVKFCLTRDLQQPIPYLVLKSVYHFVGGSEVWLRIPSLLATGLSIVFTYRGIYDLLDDRRSALWGALFHTALYSTVFFSQNLRPYALTTAAFSYFFFAWLSGRTIIWSLLALSLASTIGTLYAICLGAALVVPRLLSRRCWGKLAGVSVALSMLVYTYRYQLDFFFTRQIALPAQHLILNKIRFIFGTTGTTFLTPAFFIGSGYLVTTLTNERSRRLLQLLGSSVLCFMSWFALWVLSPHTIGARHLSILAAPAVTTIVISLLACANSRLLRESIFAFFIGLLVYNNMVLKAKGIATWELESRLVAQKAKDLELPIVSCGACLRPYVEPEGLECVESIDLVKTPPPFVLLEFVYTEDRCHPKPYRDARPVAQVRGITLYVIPEER